MLVGLMTLQEEYVRYCARKGLDPAQALPSIAALADGLKTVAGATGIEADAPAPAPQAASAPPVDQRDPTPVSEFAARYLDLRCRGLLLKRRNETPDEKTGASFRANSRRNIEATVALFVDVFGDVPTADIRGDQCAEFVRILNRIPGTQEKSNKDRRSMREIVADTDREEARAIAALTAQMKRERRSPGEIEDATSAARVERLRAKASTRPTSSSTSSRGVASPRPR
jgi:hypothetical protein